MSNYHPEDLEENLGEVFVWFTELFETDIASQISIKRNLVDIKFSRLINDFSVELYSNVENVWHIYLSLVVINCIGERSISRTYNEHGSRKEQTYWTILLK